MIKANKLADKVMAEANDSGKFCPICNRQITQHIITSKWEDVGICSCGWTSSETPAVGPHQSEFYKVSRRPDIDQTIDLVATFPSKDKHHRGRKMFKDHSKYLFTIPYPTNV